MNFKNFKLNIADIIIIVAVIAVIFFAGIKIISSDGEVSETVTANLTFYCEQVPDFAAKIIKEGDPASDQAKNIYFGKIISVVSENALIYTENSEGARLPFVKEGVKNLKITTEVTGEKFPHGIMLEGSKYSVGYTLTLYAGQTRIPAVISAIEIK